MCVRVRMRTRGQDEGVVGMVGRDTWQRVSKVSIAKCHFNDAAATQHEAPAMAALYWVTAECRDDDRKLFR